MGNDDRHRRPCSLTRVSAIIAPRRHINTHAIENPARMPATTPATTSADGLPLPHLCRVPQASSAVAALIHAEFWSGVPGVSAATLADRLARATSTDALPLCRVAMEGDVPVAVANLIDYDDPNPRVGSPWLAGVVVVPSWRGRGLGSRLVLAMLGDARRLGKAEVFLGTDGPQFYERLGGSIYQQLRSDFWLMRFALN